jgi:DNA repair exonuclease SbcCD ATPase subunit
VSGIRVMAEALEIKLEDTREWLEQETISIVEPLKAEGRRLLDDVKAKLDDVLETSDKLLDAAERKIAKGSRKTYRRAKVMHKLARNISEMIDEVTIPDEISQETLHTLCEELGKTLAKVGRERWKWFPVISPYFIMDRRRFDVALKRAMDSLEEIRSFSSDRYTKAKAVEDAFSTIDKLHESLSELDEVERHKKTELRKGVLGKKIEENRQKITAIQGQSEIVELAQINEKVEELKKKVKHSLRYLQKPFLKFQSLVLSSSYSLFLDETKKLNEYLSNPFEAFATEEEGYPMLKRILQKMDDAMAQGKLKLKKSRLRKAKDQADDILHKNALLSLHQSCKEALSKKQQLSTSGIITKSRNELAQLQKNLRDLQKRKELLDSRGTALEKKIKENFEKIEEQKRELEKIILELTNNKVQVLL